MTVHFGDNSSIASFASIPASKITGLTDAVGRCSQAKRSSVSSESSTTGSSYVTKNTLTLTGLTNNSKVLVYYKFIVAHSSDDDNASTTGRLTTTGSFVAGNPEGSSSGNAILKTGICFDDASSSGTRTYRIQFRNNATGTSTIRDTFIFAAVFEIGST